MKELILELTNVILELHEKEQYIVLMNFFGYNNTLRIAICERREDNRDKEIFQTYINLTEEAASIRLKSTLDYLKTLL